MAFVEVDKFPGLTPEKMDQWVEAAGMRGLQEGELFRVAGTADGTLIVLNAWDSREACDTAMEKYMGAAKELGISMEGMSHEEYEIHGIELGQPSRVAQ
jgi:hypothetical protein